MSLIPSESYSFPDHFTTTVVPARKPKREQADAAAATKTGKAPVIVALPNPPAKEPQLQVRGNGAPITPPNPALIRATAPPPRVPTPALRKSEPAPILKRNSVPTARVPAMHPLPAQKPAPPPPAPAAKNVIPMPPARPAEAAVENARPPLPQPKPRPAPVVATSQADFFELFAQNGDETLAKRRRKMKFRRFITYESIALAVLLPLAAVGVLYHPTNVMLHWVLNIFTIASAIAAALIPIVFYAFTPTLPEIER